MITSGKNGSQQAFENLYDTYSASLLGMITKVTGIGKMSENVLQQAFLEIWLKKANYDGSKERFFTWMIKIAFNIAILAARKGKEYTSAEIMTIKNLVYGKATEVNQD